MASYKELVDQLEALVRAIVTGSQPHAGSVSIVTAQRLVDEARRGINRPTAWTPFQEVKINEINRGPVDKLAKLHGISDDVVDEALSRMRHQSGVWCNSRYQIAITDLESEGGGPPMKWLSIKRIDKSTINDWRDFQRIKDELCGSEWEAVQLFPAASRLVDTANQYHLWARPERFAFGFDSNLVNGPLNAGEGQRPFEGNAE